MVAETGNFTRAVERRNTSQAAVVVGNIHDLVTSLVSNKCGLDDLLPSRAAADSSRCGSLRTCALGTELLRPDASEALAAKGGASLPGRAPHPVPLLMYSPRRSGDAAWLG
jgi:hypothetical protein